MPKRAIALAGGGARGPYQVGVWRGLQELGIDFDIVTGTSVGALNGALMVQGDYRLAEEMWEKITPTDVVNADPFAQGAEPRLVGEFVLQLVKRGGLDVSPLEKLLREAVDEEKVRSSPVEFGLVTTQFPILKPVQLRKAEIPQGELVDYLLASAACFPLFQRWKIGEVEYVDGAFSDNLPASLALDCGGEELIAVDLHGAGIVKPYKSEIPVTYIHSYWDLGTTLAFDPEKAKRNMRLGYQDTMKAYRKLEGQAYAFYPGESRRNTVRLHNALRQIRLESGVDMYAHYKRLPKNQLGMKEHSSRFYHRGEEAITLGRAVTSAAEITGELLDIAPDQVYSLTAFNLLCMERWSQRIKLRKAKERLTTEILYQSLEQACKNGATSDAFWGLAALSPKEFAAAGYLLALTRYFDPRNDYAARLTPHTPRLKNALACLN